MNRLATSAIVGLVSLGAMSVNAVDRTPRLVVGIVVDQLRTDYVEQLQNLFGEKGFRTLMSEGAYLRDVDFKVPGIDAQAAAATAVTGAWPAWTGVPGAMVYRAQSSDMAPALANPASNGSFNNDSFTPENLRLSTVADEFAVATDGTGVIYSVAADPQQAVILAGHAGKNAIWLNNTTGLWATSSYYGPLPSAATRTNLRNAPAHKLDTLTWRPTAGLNGVITLKPVKGGQHFNYKFQKNDRDVFRKIAVSPIGNAEVTDMAIRLIDELPQTPGTPGMINIGYTVAPYKYGPADPRAETMDAYLRLDAQIGRILDAVDKYCGKENALIWLTSTGHYDAAATDEKRFRIPGGEFSTRRATSLLNSYLSARHGNANYVADFKNGYIYLDNKEIERLHLDEAAITEDARLFLAKMSGVARTFSRHDIIAPTSEELRDISLGYDPVLGGDILVKFLPGWSVTEDGTAGASKPSRETPVMTPAFIYGGSVAPQIIDNTVESITLAPTITGNLRIRAPNGTSARPLPLKQN